MAGETSQPRRSRPVSRPSGDSDPTLPAIDPSMAPITANTPLPPVTPLPLASQSGDTGDTPPPAGEWPQSAEQSAAPPPAGEWPPAAESPAAPPLAYAPPLADPPRQPARGAAGSGVSSTWAAYTTFALMFTSLILVVAMAIAAAVISKSAAVLIWIIVLTFVVNIAYAAVVFSIARPDGGQPMRLPFMTPRRGP